MRDAGTQLLCARFDLALTVRSDGISTHTRGAPIFGIRCLSLPANCPQKICLRAADAPAQWEILSRK